MEMKARINSSEDSEEVHFNEIPPPEVERFHLHKWHVITLILVSIISAETILFVNSNLQYIELTSQYNIIFSEAGSDYIASTIVYYTNYGHNKNVLTIFINQSRYSYYKNASHPSYSSHPTDYVTPNEAVITSIVASIQSHTHGEEGLADALLSFVQDQQISLSMRYYTPESRMSEESKYPVETLVEMGGDCKGHTILYASLLKAAGYEVIILTTSDHTLAGVHLTDPPSRGTQENVWSIAHNGKKYYFAETTSYGWRVGDLPEDLQDKTFHINPVN